MRIAVVNLKGGTGKTTTAVYLSCGLAREGKTLLVDADPQGSALSWTELAGQFPAAAVGLPVRDLHRRLPELARSFEHAVIDTPPQDAGIVRSALLAADRILVALSPSLLDMDRLRPTLELIAGAEAFNPAPVSILLTRVRRGTRTAAAASQLLRDWGAHLLRAVIPLREEFARAFGTVPRHLWEYEDVLEELGNGGSQGRP
jgi:chromosome partitioning protein